MELLLIQSYSTFLVFTFSLAPGHSGLWFCVSNKEKNRGPRAFQDGVVTNLKIK